MKFKKVSILALVLIIIGLIGCALTWHSAAKTTKLSEEKRIQSTFSSLDVQSGNARVDILPITGEQAKVKLEGSEAADARTKLNVKVSGQMLHIQWHQPFRLFHIDLGSAFSEPHLFIYLPKKQYDAIHIDNDNGRVKLDKLRMKELDATTDNGELELSDISSQKVNVHSDNGGISLHRVTGRLHGETDNGRITLVTKSLDRHIELSSNNGRIDIKSSKQPTNARFDVHVDNGRVNLFNKYNGNAVIGKGKNLIKLSTDNGSITVK
ncbi:hypothetical protein GCM10011391_08050 [Pullulanibacillus camelliae]|uniref:DUF4097 domain-containing protein n=1 Tax=Pullulanibacillus camelliae TaxID=1707096 RepID=A0A8J2VLJ0_9BACL|nr:DUF4097 family beta strand repeat-containing protein [Pullulanibacillus camelliae]GGE31773.1 hypothetical protein GCM10011391_08050 [Pullulanibacillus camelliae]